MYATKADILELLSESDLIGLTDDSGSGLVDDSVVDRAIADADATIDAYCQGRYSVPFGAPLAPMIRSLSVDLAIYNLYSRRPVADVPEVRKDRRKEAIAFLAKVAEAKLSLGSVSSAPVNSGQAVLVGGGDRLFTRDSMKGL